MTLFRPLPLLAAFLLLGLAGSLRAQIDTNDLLFTDDSLTVDTLIFIPDTTRLIDTSLVIDTSFTMDDDGPPLPPPSGRSGLWGGPTVEFTTLDPASLDPQLGGSIVLVGAQGAIIWNGWVVGGAGASGRLYDLPDNYDRFGFGYGGILLGYDWGPGKQQNITVRPTLLAGFGGLVMMKKRPDFIDSTGRTILEQYREEDFFLFRPGVSVGAQVIDWMELRATVDYLLPIGGAGVGDLRKLTYGLQISFGINFQ